MTTSTPTTTALAPTNGKSIAATNNDIKEYLLKATTQLSEVAAKHMNVERLVRIALVARARTPLLMKCSKESILLSLMQAAEMGLEPNTPLQHAALVPRYNSRTKGHDATFMPMYRGLIELGRRCGVIRTARAVPVYSCDTYSIEEGLQHTIVHKPDFANAAFGNPANVVLVYAVAELVGGGVEWAYMTKPQIERIRMSSQAANDGPWVQHWEEMAKKTVLRRLMKLLPLTIEVAEAIALNEEDDRAFDMSQVAEAAGALADAQAEQQEEKRDAAADLAGEIKDKKPRTRGSKAAKDEQPATEPEVAAKADDKPPTKEEAPADPNAPRQGTLV